MTLRDRQGAPQLEDFSIYQQIDVIWADLIRENQRLREENARLRAGADNADPVVTGTAATVSADRDNGSSVPQPTSHAQCHDLVCNGDTRQPRGTKGICCSCRGRDLAYLQRDELLAALKDAERELSELNRHIGWRDGEWRTVTRARAAIAKAESR